MLKSFRRLWRELRHIATGILTWYLVGATARPSPTSSAVETSGSISAFIDHSLTRSLAARRDNARTTYRRARRHHTGVSRSWRLLGPTCMRGPYCRPARAAWGSAQGGGTCRRLNACDFLPSSISPYSDKSRSVVTSRSTTASRPSNPLNSSPLLLRLRFSRPLCAFINYIYLLT